MIGNNYIQLIMSVVKINNERRAQAGKSFLSPEGLRKVESKYIKIANYLNSIENKIVNNKFSNWLKDVFSIGMPHPLYMYSDEGDFYVMNITDGKLETGESYSDISVCQDTKYAMNFRDVSNFKRQRLLKKAKKILSERQREEGDIMEYSFRYKSVASIEANIDDMDTGVILS